MRLFVAVNLPEAEKARLWDVVAPLRAARLPVRWVQPESVHFTLKFLGEVRDEVVPRVEEVVRRGGAEVPPFELRLGGFGGFPTAKRPRVIWAGVAESCELSRLNALLEEGFEPLGYERERRAFHPHLTLGRAEKDARAGSLAGVDALLAGLEYESTLDIHTVDIMRSHLSPGGARYERLVAAPLAGEVPPGGGAA